MSLPIMKAMLDERAAESKASIEMDGTGKGNGGVKHTPMADVEEVKLEQQQEQQTKARR